MFLTGRQLVMIGLMAAAGVAVWKLGTKPGRRHRDSMLDAALGESFPASDPTATQDYAIPVNRRDPQPSAA